MTSKPAPAGEPDVTGIVLLTEMTGNVTMLLPMLGACFAAMLVPTLLRNSPIYDSLSRRQLQVKTSKDGGATRELPLRSNRGSLWG
jgi:H+/Cl- antiporter ClcA